MSATQILVGDAIERLAELPDESVHCVVTSPPYWGLRDYGTGEWEGGDAECDHNTMARQQERPELSGGGCSVWSTRDATPTRCKCGATRVDRQIGLEDSPDAWVAKLVEVFDEVRRVLRADGTCWVNLGDSYSTGHSGESGLADWSAKNARGGGHTDAETRQRRGRASGMKPKDLIGQPWRFAFAMQARGWWLRSEIIWAKCLSGGARLYARTQKGEAPHTLKDLVRLDPATVQLWDGAKWNQVVDWIESPPPDEPLELVLRNGERLGCTREHRWRLADGRIVPSIEIAAGDVLDGAKLPEPPEPVTPQHLPDEIGWFVGLYIAEGSLGKSGNVIQIASHADEDGRFERLATLAGQYGGTARVHRTSANGATCNIYGPALLGILRQYVSGHGAKGKHLDPRCWARSNVFLANVLDGYLKGDGHRRANEWRLGFCANDNLAADLRTIGARLGLSVRLKRTHHVMDGRRFPGWRGSIREPEHRRTADREVVEIARSRARRFWDVQLAEAPHVFALASGTLTHNSNPMPESCTDRPTKAHETVFLFAKSARYFYDSDAVRESAEYGRRSWSNGRATWDTLGEKHSQETGTSSGASPSAGRNARTVWTIATQPYPEAHFATFPEELPKRCILAGTSAKGCCPQCGAPWVRVVETGELERQAGARMEAWDRGKLVDADGDKGRAAALQAGGFTPNHARQRQTTGWRPSCSCGHREPAAVDDPTVRARSLPVAPFAPIPCTVLDPFSGAGTTGLVAHRLGRDYIGIELNPEYAELSRKRIAKADPFAPQELPNGATQGTLF